MSSVHPGRLLRWAVVGLMVPLLALGGALAPASADPRPGGDGADRLLVARQALPAGDGWASLGSGTTGGSAAPTGAVVTVRSHAELVAAVAGDAPKIVLVEGAIDADTTPDGRALSCEDYQQPGYTLSDYLAAYDPDVWGRDTEPSGPIEDARAASARVQAEQITVRIGSNTTIVGMRGASITGAALRIDGASNVIIRGLTISDAADCFPAWDPTDGEDGNWNSAYDVIGLTGATHVWIDGNDLSDGDNLDRDLPEYFGRTFQVHDGLLDITNGSDLVTVSYNRFHDHDKTMLIGSSDSRTTDRGLLRVSLHHNEFRDLGQRVPRVRFGQVDVYNNHYRDSADGYPYTYAWGVGVESHIVAQHNAFTLADDVDRSTVIGNYGGRVITESDNLVNRRPVDLLAAHNAVAEESIEEVPAFVAPRRRVHPAAVVPGVVGALAGPDRLLLRR